MTLRVLRGKQEEIPIPWISAPHLTVTELDELQSEIGKQCRYYVLTNDSTKGYVVRWRVGEDNAYATLADLVKALA